MDKFLTRFFIYLSLFIVPAGASGQSFQKSGTAPALKILTFSGDTADLEKLKGKIVLVEFWASWCGPCRVRNRHLVGVYNKYRECGFEILCASADENPAYWKKAVEADKLDCLHGKMSKGWYSKELRDWKVNFLPSSYLIDKEGKFIAIEPSIGVLSAWLEELL